MILRFLRASSARGSYLINVGGFRPQVLWEKLRFAVHVKRYRSERDYLLSCLQDIIPKLGLQSKKELISGHDIEHKTHWTQSELLMLRIAITSLQGKKSLSLKLSS